MIKILNLEEIVELVVKCITKESSIKIDYLDGKIKLYNFDAFLDFNYVFVKTIHELYAEQMITKEQIDFLLYHLENLIEIGTEYDHKFEIQKSVFMFKIKVGEIKKADLIQILQSLKEDTKEYPYRTIVLDTSNVVELFEMMYVVVGSDNGSNFAMYHYLVHYVYVFDLLTFCELLFDLEFITEASWL